MKQVWEIPIMISSLLLTPRPDPAPDTILWAGEHSYKDTLLTLLTLSGPPEDKYPPTMLKTEENFRINGITDKTQWKKSYQSERNWKREIGREVFKNSVPAPLQVCCLISQGQGPGAKLYFPTELFSLFKIKTPNRTKHQFKTFLEQKCE